MRWMIALIALGLLGSAAGASAQAPDGSALYLKHCKNCHGPAGGEPTPVMKARMNPPALFDAAFLAKTDDTKFMDAMVKGGQKMRPLAEKMTKPEMEAVLKYVRGYAKAGGTH
jgi:mono/diheme cytochrome c family protein